MNSIAEWWARRMQEHRMARPGLTVKTYDHNAAQPPADKEIAFVVAYDGEARCQIKGGVLDRAGAIALGHFLLEAFEKEVLSGAPPIAPSQIAPPAPAGRPSTPRRQDPDPGDGF